MNRLSIKLLFVFVVFTAFTSCKKEMVNNENFSGKKSLVTGQVINVPATASIVETQPHVYTPVTIPLSSNCGGFWQGLPANYNSTTQKYPLLIYLSGQSKLGSGSTTDLQKISGGPHSSLKKKKFPPNFIVGGKNFSFIVISPQFKGWPNAEHVDAVINYIVSKLRVDKSRIYVTGLSMGGGVTWDYAGSKYANKIAAITPVCGASAPADAKAKIIADNDIPVWAFHNQYDNKVSVNNTKNWVSLINKYNPAPKAKMTIFQDADKGHDAWTKAYSLSYKENNMNIYEWMLQYHL